jgi:hypothetical protein
MTVTTELPVDPLAGKLAQSELPIDTNPKIVEEVNPSENAVVADPAVKEAEPEPSSQTIEGVSEEDRLEIIRQSQYLSHSS